MMADISIKILDPPDSLDFLTLREAKALLGLPPTGGSPEADAQLQFQISAVSATIARLCNRTFAKTRVIETWRGVNHADIYLSLWPVEDYDLEIINGVRFDPDVTELENETGKLRMNGFRDPVRITYSGGYDLPDEAPDDLKYACKLMIQQQRSEAQRESVEGIKMIAHKESRVIFFDPNAGGKTTQATLAGSSGILTVDSLLAHYVRFWA
jgi:hypothetical protein